MKDGIYIYIYPYISSLPRSGEEKQLWKNVLRKNAIEKLYGCRAKGSPTTALMTHA